MLLLPRKELELHEDAKACYICGIRFFKKLSQDYRKLQIIVITQVNIGVQQIVFAI